MWKTAWKTQLDRLVRWTDSGLGFVFWICLGIQLRLLLTLGTFGTNDVLSWQAFQKSILTVGLLQTYRDIPLFNHPPLVGQYLSWISAVTTPRPELFPFLLRLPAVLADIGSIWVVYRIFLHVLDARLARRAAVLVAMTPILILVSGFHGNTDPVFMFLLVLAAYLCARSKNTALAGFVYGASLSIKIVPILAVPLFFFWLPDWKKRSLFFLGASVAISAGFGYACYWDFPTMQRNIFNYSSTSTVWGITQILYNVFLWNEEMVPWFKAVLLFVISAKAFALSREKEGHTPQALFKGLSWTVLLFLVFTPGFGIQYLAWFAVPSLFLSWPMAVRYHWLAGAFLFVVYNDWCDGHWWIAMSQRWIFGEWIWALCIWLFLTRWSWLGQKRVPGYA